MPTERTTPGQPFRSTPFFESNTQNRVLEATEVVHRRWLGESAPPLREVRDRITVKVKNTSGEARARGEVVKLGPSILDDVDPAFPWFESAAIAAPAFKLALLRGDVATNKIIEAQVAGVAVALVDVGDEDHTHAVPVAGSYTLESADFGPFELLTPPDGTGEQELLVRLNAGLDDLHLELTEQLNPGGSADAELQEDDSGSWTGTGRNYDVYDGLGTLNVASTKIVIAAWDPRTLRLQAKNAAC